MGEPGAALLYQRAAADRDARIAAALEKFNAQRGGSDARAKPAASSSNARQRSRSTVVMATHSRNTFPAGAKGSPACVFDELGDALTREFQHEGADLVVVRREELAGEAYARVSHPRVSHHRRPPDRGVVEEVVGELVGRSVIRPPAR